MLCSSVHGVLQSVDQHGKRLCERCIVCALYYEVRPAPWQTLPLATATNFLGKEQASAQKPVRLNL